MDHITEAFYNVMYQYRLAFTPDGVQANLNQWRQQKTPLLELLRRHPNWREQELAVVFDLSEQRQLDRACVDETKFEMLTLAEEAGLTGERLEEFRDALDAATADYATVPDESRLPVIRNRGHIKCDAGMKASRIINRLCAKFGIDQYETERELGHGDTLHTARVKPYNAVFARLADALNPVRISKTGVLSVHPCDFLEMSAKKNAWHSCHCLADGGWRAGCQSYMGDGGGCLLLRPHLIEALRVHAAGLPCHVHAHEGHGRAGILVVSRSLHGTGLRADQMRRRSCRIHKGCIALQFLEHGLVFLARFDGRNTEGNDLKAAQIAPFRREYVVKRVCHLHCVSWECGIADALLGDLGKSGLQRGQQFGLKLAFETVAELAEQTADGLQTYGILDPADRENLTRLASLARSLETISRKELRNERLSDEEYDLIREYGGTLEHFWIEAVKDRTDAEYLDAREIPASLVTDLATDPNGMVLQAANGRPAQIYVIVPVDGTLRIASGVVYNFYQFRQPLSARLTDTEWRQMIGEWMSPDGRFHQDETPEKPWWTQSYWVQG